MAAVLPQSRPRPALPGRDIKPFPARNPSYRALSIIDAYSADLRPLSQLEERQEDEPILPRSAPGLGNRNDLLKESYLGNFDIDEAYGSGEPGFDEDDMYDDEVINLDDYDPYRSTTPPPRTSSKKLPEVKVETRIAIIEVKPELPPKSKARNRDYDPFKAASPPKKDAARLSVKELASRSEPLLAVLNKVATSPAVPPKDASKPKVSGNLLAATKSTSNLSIASTPRSTNKAKALPVVPSMPKKLMASPMAKDAPKIENAMFAQAAKGLPKRPNENIKSGSDVRKKDSLISNGDASPKARHSPSSPESISRFKKAGTMIDVPTGIERVRKPASLNLTKSNGSTAKTDHKALTEQSPPRQEFKPARKAPTVAPAPIASAHVASDSAAVTTPKHANPIESSYHQSHAEPLNANVQSDSSKEEPEMRRVKALLRKPVGSISSTSSTTSKENKHPHRSLSPSKSSSTAKAQSSARQQPSHPYQHHTREQSYASNSAAFSPISDRSLEAFPPLETQTSSTTTILAPRTEAARPTTPPVLRSPTPLSQLEESPSKYRLKKKSEQNLKSVAEERQSQIFGQSANGVLRFLTAQKALQDSFVENAPRSALVNREIVEKNEINRNSVYHASLFNFVKPRPRDSNAPRLSTIQLHCRNDHNSQWHTNSNEIHPINCALCDVEDGPRWSCASCGLRVCQECCEAIKTKVENTEMALLLKAAKEETERMRAEVVAARRARSNTQRTITPSRPSSPVVYPPSDSETPYGNSGAAASTQSLPGVMRPHSRQGGGMYPPSAFDRNRIPYGRPPGGHRARMSIGSMSARDAPPTPRIPDQYLNERNSQNSTLRGSQGSQGEMRGRMGPSPERGRRHSASRHGSPMRGPPTGSRAGSRPRQQMIEIDPMAELRRAPAGAYAAIPRSAGARTPGAMR